MTAAVGSWHGGVVMNYARYLHLAIERPRPPASDDELRAVEVAFGAELPASVREFLRAAGGEQLEYVTARRTAVRAQQ